MSHKQAKKIRQFFRKKAEEQAKIVKEKTEIILKDRIAGVDKRVDELYRQHHRPKPRFCPKWLWNLSRSIFISEPKPKPAA